MVYTHTHKHIQSKNNNIHHGQKKEEKLKIEKKITYLLYDFDIDQ